MAESWQISIDRLEVRDANEDAGDEPYLVVIAFQSRFSTPDSTSVTWSGHLDDTWADGIRQGQSAGVPPAMGAVLFDNVDRLPIGGSEPPAVIGAVVIALESDHTLNRVVEQNIHKVEDALAAQLRILVEQKSLSNPPTSEEVKDAFQTVQHATDTGIAGEARQWLESFLNADETIGSGSLLYLAASGLLVEQPFTLEFSQTAGTDYRVTGHLGRLDASTWARLGDEFTSTSGPAIASTRPDRLDVFAQDANQALRHTATTFSDAGRETEKWSVWQTVEIGASPIEMSADPAATSWRIDDRLDVVVRGTDNGIWHSWFDGSWHGQESVGGTATSAPAVVAWAENRLDVFVRGTDNALWHRWWNGDVWHDWESLGGILASDPAAVAWEPERIDVVALGTDNAMWHKWFDHGDWHDWESLEGIFNASPGIASWEPQRLDIVARGTDNAAWHRYFDRGWSATWQRLGGEFSSGLDIAAPAVGRLDVVGRDTDNRIVHAFFDGASWQHPGARTAGDGADPRAGGAGPPITSKIAATPR